MDSTLWLWLTAALLGIVEGLTEFLPISSTGHLILVEQWARLPESFAAMFEVCIQLGAILAVVVHYRARLVPVRMSAADPALSIWLRAGLAVLPALVAGLLFGDAVEQRLYAPPVVAGALVVGGVALLLIEQHAPGWVPRHTSPAALPLRVALWIGVAQCLALVPGVSRSGATIVGALLLGCSRAAAAEFSFFLAVPTMAAATVYALVKHGASAAPAEWVALLIGFAVSMLVAWAVIRWFIGFLRTHDFRVFGWYRIALGLIVLAWTFMTG